MLHIPALWYFDISITYPKGLHRVKFVLYNSNICEILLYNRRLVLLTQKLICDVQTFRLVLQLNVVRHAPRIVGYFCGKKITLARLIGSTQNISEELNTFVNDVWAFVNHETVYAVYFDTGFEICNIIDINVCPSELDFLVNKLIGWYDAAINASESPLFQFMRPLTTSRALRSVSCVSHLIISPINITCTC